MYKIRKNYFLSAASLPLSSFFRYSRGEQPNFQVENLGEIVVVVKADVGRDLGDLHCRGADHLLGHGDTLAADIVGDGGIEARVEDLIELSARDGKMRAQVLDGQIPGDVVVDVFFDLLRRVEVAHLKHPLVVDVADAGVENVAGGLDLVRGIVQLHIVKRTALLFVDAKLRGVGRRWC